MKNSRLHLPGFRLPTLRRKPHYLPQKLTDNSHWLMGLFYYITDDPSVTIENRFGFGYSFNYDNRKAQLTTVTVLALLVGGMRTS